MTTVRVEVTQDDIDKGCVLSRLYCPVARAIDRALGLGSPDLPEDIGKANDDFVRVDESYIYLPGGEWVRTPLEVSDRINLYDEEEFMVPFAFDLEIPEGVLT